MVTDASMSWIYVYIYIEQAIWELLRSSKVLFILAKSEMV